MAGSAGAPVDDYLDVFTPDRSSGAADLERRLADGAESLAYYQAHDERLPHPPGDLLAIAGTDNGEAIYWARRPGVAPEDWTVVVNAARDWEEWPAFDGGLVEFLAAVLSAEHRCSAFPDDFPSHALPLSFRPYP